MQLTSVFRSKHKLGLYEIIMEKAADINLKKKARKRKLYKFEKDYVINLFGAMQM